MLLARVIVSGNLQYLNLNEASWFGHPVESIGGGFDVDAPIEIGESGQSDEIFDGGATPIGKRFDDQLDEQIAEVAVKVVGEKRRHSTTHLLFLTRLGG